jgi:hypothetical protein
LITQVEVDNCCLNIFWPEVGQVAGGATMMTPEAEEVRVGATISSGHAVAESRLATKTPQSAFQVVRSAKGSLSALSPIRQQPLNLLKCRWINDWWMFPCVLHAVVGDNADVVTVLQDCVELVGRQWPFGLLRRGPLQ